jgi:S-formylglutathione hydrolase FrmB
MKFKKMNLLFKLLIIIPFFFQCSEAVKKEKTEAVKTIDSLKTPIYRDTLISINIANIKCDIAFPDSGSNYSGNILLLQGFNFPKEDWCKNVPELCREAARRGYTMIMPDMGRSVYADTFFAETAPVYKNYPLRSALCDSLFPYLNKRFDILLNDQSNFILGLSSGARGAALIVLDKPNLFSAAGLLSGDYDQTGIPGDLIMKLYYGNFENNKKRWKEIDNIITDIDNWNTPVYIGHGKLDKVVPHMQSKQLNDSLKTRLAVDDLIFNEPVMGHDYKYWGSETLPVLNFFDRHNKNKS